MALKARNALARCQLCVLRQVSPPAGGDLIGIDWKHEVNIRVLEVSGVQISRYCLS